MKLPRAIRQLGKRVVQATPILRRQLLTSTDYQVLSGVEAARSAMASSGGWLAARTVARQERAYQGLIEVGCGSGYYSEVFAPLVPGGVRYTGIDYSEAMIARARARYPSAAFEA